MILPARLFAWERAGGSCKSETSSRHRSCQTLSPIAGNSETIRSGKKIEKPERSA